MDLQLLKTIALVIATVCAVLVVFALPRVGIAVIRGSLRESARVGAVILMLTAVAAVALIVIGSRSAGLLTVG